jgi:hypothetical protein
MTLLFRGAESLNGTRRQSAPAQSLVAFLNSFSLRRARRREILHKNALPSFAASSQQLYDAKPTSSRSRSKS